MQDTEHVEATKGTRLDGVATIGANHRPLRDKVVEELRRRIIRCDYAPGHRLTEGQLAHDFGVSRNPVREAIRVLEREGFLVVHPRRSAVVARISESDVADVFDVRLSLEVLAAQLAAQRIGGESATLDRLLAESATAQTVAELAALNTAFHAEICRLAGNALLAGIMESLHDRLEWIYRQSAETRAPHSWAEHEAMATAIRAGDAEAAAHAAHTHVLAARQSALALAARSSLDGSVRLAPSRVARPPA